jgi:acetyl-CoA carboxylase biotin carboxyl carrier protein
MMTIKEIESLGRMMKEYDLSELKVELKDCNVCLRRGDKAAAPVVVAPAVAAAPVAAAPAPVAAAPAAASAAPAAPAAVKTIDSPLVGTFYRAASPDSAPFVNVGDRVNADTVIGIIEAMKVMNEIKAEKTGVIKEILVENGQPVEFGQPLLVIE